MAKSRIRSSLLLATIASLLLSIFGSVYVVLQPRNQGGLSGIIIDPTNLKVTDAVISLKSAAGTLIAEVKSNAQGIFIIAGIKSGTYSVQISKETFDERNFENVTVDAKQTLSLGQVVLQMNPPSDLSIDEANADDVKNAPTILGAVQTPSSDPIADATVILTAYASATTSETKTNGTGSFAFTRVPLGLYNISISKPGYQTYAAGDLAAVFAKNSSIGKIKLPRPEHSEAPTQPKPRKESWASRIFSKEHRTPPDFLPRIRLLSGNLLITGVVLDAAATTVASAKVRLRSQPPGLWREQLTDGQGRFVFDHLPVGSYSIEISGGGYKAVVVSDVQLRNLKSPLSLGQIKLGPSYPVETVTITAAEVAAIPLNGRHFTDLSYLTPGTPGEEHAAKPDKSTQKAIKAHELWLSSNGKAGAVADFRRADLRTVDLRALKLERANFAGADINGADLSEANAEGAVFTGADLESADLSKMNLRGTDLSEAELSDAKLSKADLSGAYMIAVEMGRAELPNVTCQHGFLFGADLTESEMTAADFRSTDFTLATLEESRMVGAKLSDAIFRQGKLARADISSADLEGAVLEDADLSYANLTESKLTNARLLQANLRGATLVKTDLTGAKLSQADVSHTIFEPRSLPEIREMAAVRNLESITYDRSPDGLAQLQQQFKAGGYRDQERKVTYALRRREVGRLLDECNWRTGLLSCAAYWLSELFFDVTCQYGMAPGRPLELGLGLWFLCSLMYAGFIHNTGKSSLYRIYAADIDVGQSDPPRERIEPKPIVGDHAVKRAFSFVWRELRVLKTAMFFSLMCTFNIGFRDINFGRWLRLLTRREYDIKSQGFVRVIAGWQSLVSVYLIALWLLTYFGRAFEY